MDVGRAGSRQATLHLHISSDGDPVNPEQYPGMAGRLDFGVLFTVYIAESVTHCSVCGYRDRGQTVNLLEEHTYRGGKIVFEVFEHVEDVLYKSVIIVRNILQSSGNLKLQS